jgi:hypothetical protein
VISALDAGGVDVAVLDGEAVPAGGMGVCRRPQDGWLATWSRADAAVSYPLDPIAVANATAELIRLRVSRLAPSPSRS